MEQVQIKEINQHISDALGQWQDVMLMADVDEWAYLLNYSDEDLLNAMYIFNHIAQNRGIKSGFFTCNNIEQKMNIYKEALKECFGVDSVELTKKVITNENYD